MNERGERTTSDGIRYDDAAEWLLNDPETQAALRAKDDQDPEHQRRQRVYYEEATPLIHELNLRLPHLAEDGITLQRVSDLYNLNVTTVDADGNIINKRTLDYAPAIPTLVQWFPRVRYYQLGYEIIHALYFRIAKNQAQESLFDFFRNPPNLSDPLSDFPDQHWKDMIRYEISAAIGNFADRAVADRVIELATDRTYGRPRLGVIDPGLIKIKDERAPDVLMSLLDEEPIKAYVIRCLGVVRHEPARPFIEDALENDDNGLRYQAKRAMKKLNEAKS